MNLFSVCLAVTVLASASVCGAETAPVPSVGIKEARSVYTLTNGVVAADIHKRTGDLLSLKYRGVELLSKGAGGHPFGYWSHWPGPGMRITNSITINPTQNGGERAEVSIRGIYTNSTAVARTGAGGGPGGSTICDIEIRYSIGRSDSGVYTYSIFSHPKNYPTTGIGEARFGMKLNPDVFDYMTIDDHRRRLMPTPEDWDQGTELNFKEVRRMNTGIYKGQVEHKYDYSAIQFDIPAYGWSSSERKIGVWFVNPSIEYLSGGPTKVELTGHLDNNEGGVPTLLNYWRGSHYGGSSCAIAENEAWSKVIGPFLIYCNAGADHETMWHDALAKAESESVQWPYDWVEGVDYPKRYQRGKVEGQIVLQDPQAPKLKLTNVLVGLSAADYTPPIVRRAQPQPAAEEGDEESGSNTNRTAGSGTPRETPSRVGWQNDAKFYQFWVRGGPDGQFSIPAVRPGTYSLHAIADGVLGEALLTNVVIASGRTVTLGRLQWKPARYGRPLWEIGIPNRSGEEFLHGDHYWQWGLYNQYTNDFPNDVNFVIGKSDWRRDWNYAQVPRSRQQGTTWSVTFDLPKSPQGRATLRMGLAGASIRGGIQVSMNDVSLGTTGPLLDTATIRRDGIRGYWTERNVVFSAATMKAGKNVLKLTIPGGIPTNGVIYDYLRLELDESQPFIASASKKGSGAEKAAVQKSVQ